MCTQCLGGAVFRIRCVHPVFRRGCVHPVFKEGMCTPCV